MRALPPPLGQHALHHLRRTNAAWSPPGAVPRSSLPPLSYYFRFVDGFITGGRAEVDRAVDSWAVFHDIGDTLRRCCPTDMAAMRPTLGRASAWMVSRLPVPRAATAVCGYLKDEHWILPAPDERPHYHDVTCHPRLGRSIARAPSPYHELIPEDHVARERHQDPYHTSIFIATAQAFHGEDHPRIAEWTNGP